MFFGHFWPISPLGSQNLELFLIHKPFLPCILIFVTLYEGYSLDYITKMKIACFIHGTKILVFKASIFC